MRLDRWFHVHFPELGFGHLQKLIRSGQVRVDGGRVKTNTRLEPGQAVRVPPFAAGRTDSGGRATRPAGRREPEGRGAAGRRGLALGPVRGGAGRRSSGPRTRRTSR